MTIDLKSGTGLFDRHGARQHLIDILHGDIAEEVSAGGWAKELADLLALYDDAELAVLETQEGQIAAFEQLRSSVDQFVGTIRQAAEQALIETAHDDNPLPTLSVEEALKELIRQMEAGAETVDACQPTGAATSSASNDGDGVGAITLNNTLGRTCETALAEDIEAVCNSNTTAGRERFAFAGEAAIADRLSHAWPGGSGAAGTLTAKDATSGSDNKLANGTFEDFTANTPDGWEIEAGAAGTEILEETTEVYSGSAALALPLTATDPQLRTQVSGLSARTVYAVSFRAKRDATAYTTGSFGVRLMTAAPANILTEIGTINLRQWTLDSLTTSWQAFSTFFMIADPLPAEVFLRLYTTGAGSAGSPTMYVDHMLFTPATELYAGGPHAAIFSGATPFGLDDRITFAVTNDYRGAFQMSFHRFFNTGANGLWLPSNTAGTETIDDALIG